MAYFFMNPHTRNFKTGFLAGFFLFGLFRGPGFFYILLMPELPEVETVMRGLEPALLNQTIREVSIRRPDLRIPFPPHFAKMLRGRQVTCTRRVGKYILFFLDNGEAFCLHLGMSGRVRVYSPAQLPPAPGKHDHMIIVLINGAQVVYNDPRRFGMVFMIDAKNWQYQKPFAQMGPEPLGNGFNGPVLKQALAKRSGAVKSVLLNQSVVAGIGNIYACEALYESRLSPLRAANRINEEESERLAGALKDVLNRAIEAGGSTLKDHALADGSLGYFQHQFSVYDREGETCRRCAEAGNRVQKSVLAGRSTFYCANCQR